MNKKYSFDSFSQINTTDSFNQQSTQKIQLNTASNSKPHNRFLFAKVLIAVCIISFTAFGTTFALNQDFKSFIISFIESDQIETPITELTTDTNEGNEHKQGIRYLGQQEITDIAEVNYYQFEHNFDISDNTISTKTENNELIVYKLNENALTELPLQNEVNDVIHIRGLDIPLRFLYVIDDRRFKTFDNAYDKMSGGQATAVWSSEGENIWVSVAFHQEYCTYLLYNLKTGTIRDVISDAGIELTQKAQVTLSPNEKVLLVNDVHGIYLIDAENGNVNELSALYNLSDNLWVSFIDDETLSVINPIDSDKNHYSIYSYNIASGEITTICEDSSYGNTSDIIFLGKGITILAEPEQYVLIDGKSGARYPIEGLKPDSSISFLLSPNGSKILVTTHTGQKGLGITQFGCIDIENRTLKVFERKDFTNYEASISWNNDNEVAVTATGEKHYLYLYKFK